MNDCLLKRYTDYFSSKNEKIEVVNCNIFKLYNKMVVPFGPVQDDYTISNEQAMELLRNLGGIMVRWTNGKSSTNNRREWYAVICSNFESIETLKSKQRNEIRRGLNNCVVKRIEPLDLINTGYDIYQKAFMSYRNLSSSIISENQFKKDLINAQNYDDIIHYFGVYYKNNLVAYSTNYIFETIEASYSSIKLNPDYLSFYPSYALIYEMNKFYLADNKFEYVNDGFRSILHETNIQNYLIRKFNFEKLYLDLDIYYRPVVGFGVKLAYPFRNVFNRFDRRFNAIMELERIRRNDYE